VNEIEWKDFATDPPYDSYEDEGAGLETDATWAWFVYRYKHRKHLNGKEFLSHAACKFQQGLFVGYESHMKTSPYPEDRIEVIKWASSEDIRNKLIAILAEVQSSGERRRGK